MHFLKKFILLSGTLLAVIIQHERVKIYVHSLAKRMACFYSWLICFFTLEFELKAKQIEEVKYNSTFKTKIEHTL